VQAASALAGGWHGLHEVPQLFGLSFARQLPLQSCFPAGQAPPQERPFAMQAPMQRNVPCGHSLVHELPSHPALPPAGASHGVQDVPQLFGSSFFTQASPQR
jgi:hypothetical protein